MSFARYRNKHSAAYPPQKFLIFMMNASCLCADTILFVYFLHTLKRKNVEKMNAIKGYVEKEEEQILIDIQ